MMRVGGMQLFQLESSEKSDKPFARIIQLIRAIAIAYVGLTFACTLALAAAGMNFFDAVNHAMTALATGGYSTKDASIGYYHSVPIEIVLIVFMTLGALPLLFYTMLLFRGRRAFLADGQISGFLKVLGVAIFLSTAWNVAHGMRPGEALRTSAFNVTSVLTDTGFATADFSAWGSFAIALFFVLYFIGGCAGSTAGAVKIFRWQLLYANAMGHLRRAISPNRVLVLKYQERRVDNDTIDAVTNFLLLYVLTFVVLTLLMTATGLDFLSSSSAIAEGMANAGPGLGPIVGPATNFDSIPAAAKWLTMISMVLGRLELVTVYVTFLPELWLR